MTCRAIFDSAVALLCEDPTDSSRIFDYTERAPYLLAMVASQCHATDTQYRVSHGLEAAEVLTDATIPLEDEFPLSPILAPAAVYYVAAMLVADENEALSDKLFALYTDAVSTVGASLPAKTETINDVYGLI